MPAFVDKPPLSALLKKTISGLCVSVWLLLSGCAALQSSPLGGSFLQPSEQHLQLAAGFSQPQTTAVAYRDPSEYEEYLQIRGGARAEAILSVANGPQTALEFSKYKLHSLTESWAFNQKAAHIHWDATQHIHIGDRTYDYALYQHQTASQKRSCMAFVRAWDRPPDDPKQRPGKALFGYYCAPPGKPVTQRQATVVLRGIQTKTDDIPPVYYGQDVPHDRGALKWARGQASAGSGNPRFPFQFSRYYHPSGSKGAFF